MSKKLWTRADARAEMNREVKSCEDALKTLYKASRRIAMIGQETSFETDARDAVQTIRGRALRSTDHQSELQDRAWHNYDLVVREMLLGVRIEKNRYSDVWGIVSLAAFEKLKATYPNARIKVL